MEYEIRTYFDELEQDDVNGFAVIGTVPSDNEYQVAEKWQRADAEDIWIQYHIPASDLQNRISDGNCETKGNLTQEQYEAVCQKVGMPTQSSNKVSA